MAVFSVFLEDKDQTLANLSFPIRNILCIFKIFCITLKPYGFLTTERNYFASHHYCHYKSVKIVLGQYRSIKFYRVIRVALNNVNRYWIISQNINFPCEFCNSALDLLCSFQMISTWMKETGGRFSLLSKCILWNINFSCWRY